MSAPETSPFSSDSRIGLGLNAASFSSSCPKGAASPVPALEALRVPAAYPAPNPHRTIQITKDVATLKNRYCPRGKFSNQLKLFRDTLKEEEISRIDQTNRSTSRKNLLLFAVAATIVIVCAALLAATALSGGLAAPLLAIGGIGIGSGLLAYSLGLSLFDSSEDQDSNPLLKALNNVGYNNFIENLSDNYEIASESIKQEGANSETDIKLDKELYSRLLRDSFLLSKWEAIRNCQSASLSFLGNIQELDEYLASQYNLQRKQPSVQEDRRAHAAADDDRKLEAESSEDEDEVEEIEEEESKEITDQQHIKDNERFYEKMADLINTGQFFYCELTKENHEKYASAVNREREQCKKEGLSAMISPSQFAQLYEDNLTDPGKNKLLGIMSKVSDKNKLQPLQQGKVHAILERLGFHKLNP